MVKNVKTDFGAVGDGVTDDTAAIQNALNSGDYQIYAPTGNYKVSADLVRPTQVQFYGDGPACTVIQTHHDYANAIKGAYNTVTDSVDYTASGGVSNMTIRRVAGNISGSVGLRVVNHRQSIFSNLYIDNFFNGVLLAGCALENQFNKVRVNTAMDSAWVIYENPRHNVFIDCYGFTCGINTACYYIQSGPSAPVSDLSFFGCEAEAGNYTDPVTNTAYMPSGTKGWRMFGDTGSPVTNVAIYAPRIDFSVGGTSYGFSQESGSQNIAVRDPYYTGCTHLYEAANLVLFSITNF